MFKLGIFRLDQYRNRSSKNWFDRIRAHLSRNRVALSLLPAEYPALPEQIALFEEIVPQVRLSSGVYRTTYRGRFQQFDEFVNGLLARRLNPDAPLKAQDWAASDCLASSEWAASLFQRFPRATLTASDLTLFLVESRLPGGDSIIMELNGEPLQYIRRRGLRTA